MILSRPWQKWCRPMIHHRYFRPIFSVCAGAPALAFASDLLAQPLAPFEASCPTTGPELVLTHDDIVASLMVNAGVAPNAAVRQVMAIGQLGSYAADPDEYRTTHPDLNLPPDRNRSRAYAQLLLAANRLAHDGPADRHSRVWARQTGDWPEGVHPNVSLLNGPASWLAVGCRATSTQATNNSDPSSVPALLIGGDLSDLLGAPIGKRTFATLSYLWNGETDDSQIEADIVIGFPSPLSGSPWTQPLRPYLTYQRRTGANPLNDLSLGVSARYFLPNNQPLYFSAEYMTDDAFDSSAWRAELRYFPSWLNFCGTSPWREDEAQEVDAPSEGIGMMCSINLAVDHTYVEDPGDKTTLAALTDYTRWGGGVSVTAWHNLRDQSQIQAAIGYDLREPFDGRLGDAARGWARVTFIPSIQSRFSFNLDYSNGEDLTSLVQAEILKASIGFRY